MKRELSVEAINLRLKKARVRVAVNQMGNRLYLQATLPPPPGETKRKQRFISLGIYGNSAGLQRAEAEAKKLGALLACKEFDWNSYRNPQPDTGTVTVAEWIDRFKAHYFSTRGQNPETELTWKKNYYGFVFKHLPQKSGLEATVLIAGAQRPKANTRSRQYTCQVLQQFARFTGVIGLLGFSVVTSGTLKLSKPKRSQTWLCERQIGRYGLTASGQSETEQQCGTLPMHRQTSLRA